jgi:hypothetical protein
MAIAGRGTPAESLGGTKQEARVLTSIQDLNKIWKSSSSSNNKDVKDLCSGTWRALYTTNEKLKNISKLQGGPLLDYFEYIGDDYIITAAPTKCMMFFLLMICMLPLQLTIAGGLRIGFFGGILLVNIVSHIMEAISFTGLFASRRKAFDVDQDLIATSTLDRDVICIVASKLGFDRTASNPMIDFTKTFNSSDGVKDPLKPSLLLGWRFIPKYLAIHVLSASKGLVRKEHILYIDDDIRIMQGGDVALDGTVSQYLTVYEKVSNHA